MTARTLLVGESNPYATRDARFAGDHYALYPLPDRSAGGRLCAILRLTPLEYLRRFDRCNLLDSPRWSAPTARCRAETLLATRAPGDSLVLCGARVAAAFGLDFTRYLLAPVHRARCVTILVVPHPSGLSRSWNEPGMADRVRSAVEALGGTVKVAS